MNPDQSIPTLFCPEDTYVHEPLLDYLVKLHLCGYLSVNELLAIEEFLVSRDIDYLLNVLVSDPHTCTSADLPTECYGDTMPTLGEVLDHLQRVGDLTEEDVNYIKEYLQELDIQDILVLQVMEEEEGFDDIGN